MHLGRCLGKENGCLSRGGPPAHHSYLFRITELCLHMGRVVINSSTRESICILYRQSRVLSTCRDHYATRIELQARFQNNPVWLPAAIDMHDGLGDHQLSAKFLSLSDRSICELLSREPCWKAQVIFDL